VINPTLFTMMVLMALVTTFATTPLLELIYPADKLAADLIAAVEPAAAPATTATIPTTLVCVAHPGSGPGLVTVARALKPLAKEVKVIALHLMLASERGSFVRDRSETGSTPSALGPALDRAREVSLPVTAMAFVSADPAADICGMAKVKRADLILVGAHRPILTQTRLGGIVHEVLEGAPVDVGILIERGPLTQVKRVLVPFLGSPDDRAALALARRSLDNVNAEVTILHVVKPERAAGDSALGAKAEADKVFDEPRGRVVFKAIEDEEPAEAAVKEAANGYDLVIIGFGPEWGIKERVFGILPEPLMQDCPTSLLVVRHEPATVRLGSEPG
jgi:nucleotide-binding universal stress UspA family protein